MKDADPKVFLCHSSVDKQLAERIARDLHGKGVTVWYDAWQIQAGDSLRRKIEAGIEGATHFLVLLTPDSVKSEWVQSELDGGLTKKIEGTCRLIPVLAREIKPKDLPPILRSLRCVIVDNYEEGLTQIVNACFNVAVAPPVLRPPDWIRSAGIPESSATPQAQKLALLLCQASQNGLFHDPMLTPDDIRKHLTLTDYELADAADELEAIGWVSLRKALGMGRTGFITISPQPQLFFACDPVEKGTIPGRDARELAGLWVNGTAGGGSLEDAAKQLGWPPRRINPAAAFLSEHGYVDPSKEMGTYPFVYRHARVTARTRRFLAAE